MGHRGTFAAHVAKPPDRVFATIVDVARLPEWNAGISGVVEQPEHLQVGSVWKVGMRALGQSWVSRAEAREIDSTARRFSYRSQTDDGNPSFADWSWLVEPEGEGSRVTVTYDLNPRTFWRKHLLVKVREPALRKEIQRSLAALEGVVAGSDAAPAG